MIIAAFWLLYHNNAKHFMIYLPSPRSGGPQMIIAAFWLLYQMAPLVYIGMKYSCRLWDPFCSVGCGIAG
jgi:hypothetical protein